MTDSDILTTKELAKRVGTSSKQIIIWKRQNLIASSGKDGRQFLWFWSTTRRRLIEAGLWDEYTETRKYRKKQWKPLAETVEWAKRLGLWHD